MIEQAIEKKPIGHSFSDVTKIVLASLLVGVCAQIKISVPFSLVPFTGQTFGVMLVGALLGSHRGWLAAALYLIEGAIGLPVFAGGSSGLIHFFGPTGGYLLTYPLMSFFIGSVMKKHSMGFLAKGGWMSLISCAQLGVGALWLALFVGLKNAVVQGFFPFILLEICKVGMVLKIKEVVVYGNDKS